MRSGDRTRIGPTATPRDVTRTVPLAAIGLLVVIQLALFGVPLGIWVRGLVLGALNAMLAIGMALIYRANRVVNFSQADLGTIPASFSTAFILFWGWPYLGGLGAGLVLAVASGVVVEFALVRRFRNAPRLIATAATLGMSQLFVVVGVLIPRWWGRNIVSERVAAPLDWKLTIGVVILNANDLIAIVVAPVAILGVAWFLNRSRLGLAVRANAEHHERAAMLGLPVTRLNSVVWAIASVLAFLALFLKAPITGFPLGFATSLESLMLALAALVVGRLERLPTVALAAVVFGLFENCVTYASDLNSGRAYALLAAVVFVVLLVQPNRAMRRDDDSSSWRGAEPVRPLPRSAWGHRAIVAAAVALAALAAFIVIVWVPLRTGPDIVLKSTSTAIYAIIVLSLVILIGWAGQISLGQMALVGVGAAVSTTLTSRWQVDLTLACLGGGAAAACAALVVGLPALRLRGLYLAVTTFAFGIVTSKWLLNDKFFGWFPGPGERIEPPPLFGRIRVDTPVRFYVYSLVMLALVMVAVAGIRRSRAGRVIVALRDNERGAQAYAIPTVRTKLAAFIISGTVAGIGGGMLAHLQAGFIGDTYSPGESLTAFTSAIVGGLGLLGGAVLGALYQRGLLLIRSAEWQLLTSGFGLLIVLLVLPGGLGGLVVRGRDAFVRLIMGADTASSGRADTQEPTPTNPQPSDHSGKAETSVAP
jgi:branched-chain amino acid transport system permease protein